MSKHPSPANAMALAALCVSVAFSSLPSAVAQTAGTAASKLGFARRAKTADSARRLGKYRPIKPNSRKVGTRKAKNKVLPLDRTGHVPRRALPAISAAGGTPGPRGATGPRGPAGARGATGLRGATGPAGSTGAKGATGDDGAIGPIGPIGPAGSVASIVVRSAQSPLGSALGSTETATASCQAGEKLLGGSGFVGSDTVTPLTSLLNTDGLIAFVSTAGGVPVASGTVGASSYTVKGQVGATSRVVSQAFCATS